jgi:ankyrin repeat protein
MVASSGEKQSLIEMRAPARGEGAMDFLKKFFGGQETEELSSARDLGEALLLAVYDRDIKRMRALLARGADPGYGGIDMNAVQAAAYRGYGDALRVLLKNGADPNRVNEPFNVAKPIQLAAAYGHLKATKLLIDAGASISGTGAIQWARDRGHEDIARLLLFYQDRLHR